MRAWTMTVLVRARIDGLWITRETGRKPTNFQFVAVRMDGAAQTKGDGARWQQR
jgi:hypothetical protein